MVGKSIKLPQELSSQLGNVPIPVSARRTIKIILSADKPAPRDIIPKSATPARNAASARLKSAISRPR